MNDDTERGSEPKATRDQTTGDRPAVAERSPLFQRADWLSFAVTMFLALGGYWLTLAPDVALEFSGIFSVGARQLWPAG